MGSLAQRGWSQKVLEKSEDAWIDKEGLNTRPGGGDHCLLLPLLMIAILRMHLYGLLWRNFGFSLFYHLASFLFNTIFPRQFIPSVSQYSSGSFRMETPSAQGAID
jgi:hypothetical protein